MVRKVTVDFQALLYLKGSTNLIFKRKLSQIIIAMTHWNAIGCTNLLVCYFKVISGANKTQCSVFCPKKYPTQSYIVPNHSLPTRWARRHDPCHMLQYNYFHQNIYLSLLAAHACPVALILAPIIVICGGVAKLANHSPTQSYVTVDTLFVAVSYWALYCGTVS